MDFADQLHEFSEKAKKFKEHLTNEEATKNSLILPFLQLLGYDTADPCVVVPEYTADSGTKKKEKVDYAIMKDGQAIILMECKTCGNSLDAGKANQLNRYFQNTLTARVGILTDGIIYKFFSDLDVPNIMDQKPYMVFDLRQPETALFSELKKLSCERFDEDSTLCAAQNLKYTREITKKLRDELNDPSIPFVKFFASQVYSGQLRSNILEEFTQRVKKASSDCINGIINSRLKVAMTEDAPTENEQTPSAQKSEIETTKEEIEGYHIVKSIIRTNIALSRVVMRDAKSYCAILVDNNRKPLCRLHFNAKQKYLGLFDDEKNETRFPIQSLDGIYDHADALKIAATQYA